MLDELAHFLLIHELGTFTRAAEFAHLSQPALTMAIQRLEDTLGAQLFVRGRRGATLTAAGEALVPYAQLALSAVEDGRRAVAEVMALRAGEVRLGGGATACTYLLPAILAEFHARYPGVRLTLRESTSDEALAALAAGELDLCVVADSDAIGPRRARPTTHLERWRDDEMVLVAAPALAAELDPEQLGEAPFISFRHGTTRTLLDRLFPAAEIVMELGSLAAIKGNVRAGIGVALLSRSALERDLEHGLLELVEAPNVPLRYRLLLAHRGRERLPPAAAALRALLLGEQTCDG
jgi:DNA-binding transcriptional LysR family regulator